MFLHQLYDSTDFMTTALRPRTLVLFVGDILFFTLSLWLSLWARTGELPPQALFGQHLAPFSLLFVAWVVVFFIAGLYESRLLMFARRELGATLLYAQLANIVIAALFFFFVPLFGIAPKTLLVIYSVVSFFCVLLWRVIIFPRLGLQKKETAIIVGAGAEIDELVAALRDAPRGPVRVCEVLAPGAGLADAVQAAVARCAPSFIIAHWQEPLVSNAFPNLTKLLASGIRFIDAMSLYEEVFGRVPLSVLDDRWLARNVSRSAHLLYDPLKRVMEICIAGISGVVSLVLYPCIALAIKLDDGGEVFVRLPRIGRDNKIISILKFRSMTGNDGGAYGAAGASKLTVTRVGGFLRRSRLDELPQLWNVLSGGLSLIGPRPETPSLVAIYDKEIPYYNVRHLITPGLSGWAQLYHDNHPHAVTDVNATREKLSYDLYYLKHRSLILDATIVLKTIKKLLTRSGV
jgi:lipopolysaccharide/colanic/teichoic acid biosynthesis glycosyltransferase